MKFASRMNVIDSSGIRKVFDLAKTMKDPVNLSIGQPDFDVPEILKESAITAINKGFNSYTLTQGLTELREKIKNMVFEKKGAKVDDVIITSGVSGGILLTFLTLLDPGDEVVFSDPYFVMYKHLCRFTGAVPKYLQLDEKFRILPENLAKVVSDKTKLIVLNSPSNPTGVVNSPDELKAVADIASRFGITVVSDEIYDGFVYDGEYESIAKYYPDTLILGGFSKEYAMTGWRVGYAAGNSDLIKEMIKLQQYTFVCAPSIAQYAALDALDYNTDYIRRQYAAKRDMIYNGIKDNFNVVKPGGAFYIYPEAPNLNATEFVKRAIENNLLIIPGNVFSEKDTHIRISFAAPDATIERGISILNKLASEFKRS